MGFMETAEALGMPRKMLYSVAEVVAVTGASRDAVYRAMRSGALRRTGKGTRALLRPEWVDEWIEEAGR